MKIYRLENADKEGVYQQALCALAPQVKFKQQYSGDNRKHPTPEDDSKFVQSYRAKGLRYYDWSPGYVFGFESPEQVLRWFYDYDDLIALEYAGFHISIYECDDVIVGNTQVAFNGQFHQTNSPLEIISMCQFLDKFSNIHKQKL